MARLATSAAIASFTRVAQKLPALGPTRVCSDDAPQCDAPTSDTDLLCSRLNCQRARSTPLVESVPYDVRGFRGSIIPATAAEPIGQPRFLTDCGWHVGDRLGRARRSFVVHSTW